MANYFEEKYKTADTVPAVNALQQPDVQSVTQPANPAVKGDNYFANKYASPVTNANAKADTASQQTPSTFDAALDGFNRSFGRMAEGGMQMVANLVGATDYAAKVKGVHDEFEAQAKQSQEAHPVAYGTGNFLGNIGRTVPALVATSGMGLGMGVQAGVGAATNLATEGLEYADTGADRVNKMAMGGVTGAIGGAGGALLGKVIGTGHHMMQNQSGAGFLSKMFNPESAAKNAIANEVDNVGGMAAIEAKGLAAKNAGLYLDPAEQIGSGSAKTTVSDVVLQSANDKKGLMASFIARDNKAKTMLKETIDGFTPLGKEETAKAAKGLYDELKTMQVTPEQGDELLANPTIVKAMQEFRKSDIKSEELSKLPIDNVYVLNALKKQIDDELYSNTSKSTVSGAKVLNSTEKEAYMEARNKLVDVLTKASTKEDGTSVYAEANKLAQQTIMQRNVIKDIQNIALKPGQEKPTLSQIHSTLFSTPAKKAEFLKMVDTTGGNSQVTSDLIDTMNLMKTGSIDKVMAREVGQPSVSVSGRLAGIYQHFMQNVVQGKYNAELTKLLTDNKWQGAVEQVLADRAKSPNLFMKGLKGLLTTVRGRNDAFSRSVPLAAAQGAVGYLTGK